MSKKIDKTKTLGKIYNLFESVMFLAYLNLLWLLFTLLGAILFGWAPATAVSYKLLAKHFRGESTRDSLHRVFFEEYKTYFLRANYLGYSSLIVGVFIVFGVLTITTLPRVAFYLVTIFYGAFASLFLVASLYSLPVLVRYETSYFATIKSALFISVAHLHHAFGIIFALVFTVLFFMSFPSIAIFFLFSLPVLIVTWISEKSFSRIDRIVENERPVSA